MNRQALTPSSALPLVYFGWAHAGLGLAFAVLALDPALPGGYFLHPRMAAVAHLVTIAWISGSMLGAFYVVAPLALGMPLPVGRADWLSCAAFMLGTVGMVAHFWLGQYGGLAWSGLFVLAAVVWLGGRAAAGLGTSTAPGPVLLHVMLAFANMAAAALFGILIGIDRATGAFGWSPLSAAVAHVHLAAIGWPMMMVVGLAYRLVPMFLPVKMPADSGLAASAVLIEVGLVALVFTLLAQSDWVPAGAACIVAGLVSFVRQMRMVVRHKLPRPPALPARDWSTWQTHVAIGWLLVASALGLVLAWPARGPRIGLVWIYGVAGLVGFIAQIVVGIQGRLLPLYAYYRAMAARGGLPPVRGANDLPTPRYARPIFALWTVGVPWLAWGLATTDRAAIRGSSLVLLAAVIVGAAYMVYLVRAAGRDAAVEAPSR